jgi:V8-like Glu-specific endopeptidase
VTREVFKLDADVRPGQSGTPVMRHGRLVGVIFARSTSRPHTAYAVAGASLRQITASAGIRRAASRTPSNVRTG